jgi:hypothetical protein
VGCGDSKEWGWRRGRKKGRRGEINRERQNYMAVCKKPV